MDRASAHLLLPLLVACGGGQALTITSPTDGALLATHTVAVQGEVELDVMTVEVNGVEAAVEDGRFEARIELPDGPAEIVARADHATDSVRVEVDTTAPRIRLDSPEPASFIGGTRLRATGRVDDGNLSQVTLGGTLVDVDENGSFDVEREVTQGPQRMRLEASDSAGNRASAHISAITGYFAPPREPVEDAIALRIGAGALRSLSESGSAALAALDLQPLLTSSNPVYDAWWGEVHLVGEHHGEVDFSVTPRRGALALRVSVQQVRVDFRIDSGLGDRDGKVEADPFVLEADIRLSVGPDGLSAEVGRPLVRLDGFRFDVDDFPDFIESYDRVRDEVRRRLEEALVKAVEDFFPRWLNDMFQNISRENDLEVNGRTLRAFAEPSYVQVEPAGMALDTTVGAFALHPLPEHTDAPGYLRIDRSAFDDRVLGEDVLTAVSLDAMNAALHAMWASGAMTYRATSLLGGDDELRVEQLAVLLPSLRGAAPGDAPAAIEVEAALPPAVVPGAGGALEGALADLRIRAVADVEGTERTLLELSVGIRGRLDLTVREGTLALEHGPLELQVDQVSGPEGTSIGSSVEELLREMVERGIGEVLSAAATPLPDLEGFRLDIRTIRVRQGYLVIEGPIVFEPDDG